MIYINNDITNPYFNLSLEEYFLKSSTKEYFILWRNEPCIVIGKNQNAYSEINIEYVKNNKIPIVRRLSGGGAVFHDLGNLNFTFISNDSSNTFADFLRFTTPIIEALNKLSIKAGLSGRNDLLINNRKFSGNAQAKYKNRVLHHGTLLFSSSMKDLSLALNVRPIKFEGKSIKSTISRVTNISEHLQIPMNVIEFKDFILNHIMESDENAYPYVLSEADLKHIHKLQSEKYSTWEWNFGSSPKYSFVNEKKFSGGIVEVNLNVKKGIITDIKFFGDFFAQEDISDIETSLKNIPHLEGSIRERLENFDIDKYFSGISMNDILSLFF